MQTKTVRMPVKLIGRIKSLVKKMNKNRPRQPIDVEIEFQQVLRAVVDRGIEVLAKEVD